MNEHVFQVPEMMIMPFLPAVMFLLLIAIDVSGAASDCETKSKLCSQMNDRQVEITSDDEFCCHTAHVVDCLIKNKVADACQADTHFFMNDLESRLQKSRDDPALFWNLEKQINCEKYQFDGDLISSKCADIMSKAERAAPPQSRVTTVDPELEKSLKELSMIKYDSGVKTAMSSSESRRASSSTSEIVGLAAVTMAAVVLVIVVTAVAISLK